MAGTFGSLTTSASALRYHQSVMEVASGNIANVATDGYARRRVVGVSVGAPVQPAMWSRYEGHGEGVRVGSVDRLVDPLLDARARREHGTQSYLDTRAAALARVESGLGEPAGNGISTALTDVRKAWHDLANNPGSDAVRTQVVATSQGLVDAIAAQRRNVETEEGDQRMSLLADLDATTPLRPTSRRPTRPSPPRGSRATTRRGCSTPATRWPCACGADRRRRRGERPRRSRRHGGRRGPGVRQPRRHPCGVERHRRRREGRRTSLR